MASASHPKVDFDKAVANGLQGYYELVETLPHMMKGVSAADMQQLEREEAVKEWKRTCAMDERDGYTPENKLTHKRIGGDDA